MYFQKIQRIFFVIVFIQDTPDSPKDESHNTLEPGRGEKEGKRQSRHLLFTTHFPLPQVRFKNDLRTCTNFEMNFKFIISKLVMFTKLSYRFFVG